MIKVKFALDFSEELKRIDGNTIITGYSLETSPNPDPSVTPTSYILRTCGGVWDSGFLNVYIEFPKDYIVNPGEGNTTRIAEFNTIRFYSGSKTAFIIYHDVGGDYFKFSQTKNLFKIEFPSTTISKVKVSGTDSDTTYLEGPGITGAINVFQEEKYGIVDKDSWYRYSLGKTTKKEILDETGKRVDDNFVFRVYSDLKIQVSNLTKKRLAPDVRYGLNEDGGTVAFHGEVSFTEYKYYQGEIIELGKGTCGAYGLPGLRLKCVGDRGFDYKIDNVLLEVKYGYKLGEHSCVADFILELGIYNYLLGKVETIKSDPIRLTQQNKNLDWNIVATDTIYTENDCPLFLFQHNSATLGEIKHLTVHTYLAGSTDDIEIEYSDPRLEEKISIIPYLLSIDPETDERIYNFSIFMNEDNEEDTWFPGQDELQQVPYITLRYETYEIIIYVVQKSEISGIELDEIISTTEGDDYLKIDSIYITRGSQDYKNLIVSLSDIDKDNTDSSVLGEETYWKLVSKPAGDCKLIRPSESDPEVMEEIDYGELVYGKSSISGRDFSVVANYPISDAYDKEIGNLVFRRISEDEKDDTFPSGLEWRDEIDSKNLSIPVILEGNSVTLTITDKSGQEIQTGTLTYDLSTPTTPVTTIDPEKRIITLGVNSNCRFKAYFIPAVLSQGKADVHFIETGKDYYESENYSGTIHLIYDNIPEDPSGGTTLGRLYIIATDGTRESVTKDFEIKLEIQTYGYPVNLRQDYKYGNYILLGSYETKTRNFNSTVIPGTIETLLDPLNPYLLSKTRMTEHIETPFVDTYYSMDLIRDTVVGDNRFYPVGIEDRIVALDSIGGGTFGTNLYILPKAISPDLKITLSGQETNTLCLPKGQGDTVTYEILSRYAITFSGSVYPCINTFEPGFNNSYSISFVPEPQRRSDGWYHNKLILETITPYSTEVTRYGTIEFKSSIFEGSITYDSLIENYSSIESTLDPAFPTSIPQDWITWVNKETGYLELDIPVFITNTGGDSSTNSLVGIKNANIPVDGGTYSYYLPGKTIQSSNFLNFINTTVKEEIGGLVNIGYDSYVSNLRALQLEQPFSIYDPSYLSLSESRLSGFDFLYLGTSETIRNTQLGIQDGILFWCKEAWTDPKLFVDVMEDNPFPITFHVDGSVTSINIMTGLVPISEMVGSGLGTSLNLDTFSITKEATSSDFTYDIVSRSNTFFHTKFSENLVINFLPNTGENMKEYIALLKVDGKQTTHSIRLIIKQRPSRGNIYCLDEAYFYSNGECFSRSNTEDLGYFYFSSDLNDPDKIYIALTEEDGTLIDPEEDIEIENLGDNNYKAKIKLKPNSTGFIKTGYIKFYSTYGSLREPVKFMQGMYSVMLQSPTGDTGIFGKQSEPSILGPYEMPGDRLTGTDVHYGLSVTRKEPDGLGGWIEKTGYEFSSLISLTTNARWSVTGSETNIGNYLSSYNTAIVNSDSDFYVYNSYEAKSSYFRQELPITIELWLTTVYPTDESDPWYLDNLNGKYLTMKYIIKLKKKKL